MLIERLNQVNTRIFEIKESIPEVIELIELLDEKAELIELINEELKQQKDIE